MMLDGFSHYERSASPPRRQRACYNCSKAKARCNFQDENIGKHCDRCHRLGTECMPQTTKSLRRPRQLKLTPRESRGSLDLENYNRSISPADIAPQCMLDHTSPMATGLVPGTPFPVSPAPNFMYSPLNNLYYPFPPTMLTHPSPTTQDIFMPEAISPNPYPVPSPSSSRTGSTSSRRRASQPGHGLTWDQAEQALTHFQTRLVPHFPFVVVEAGMNARQLYAEKPFLFRVILSTAARVTAVKRMAMRKGVLAYLGHHLLVPEDRYLDMLQGLLVLIAWGDLDFSKDRQFSHLISVAKDYAYNLGLTQIVATKAPWIVEPQEKQNRDAARRLDEQRAFLGTYYVTAAHSGQFGLAHDFQKPETASTAWSLGDLDESTAASVSANALHTVNIQAVIDRIIAATAAIRSDDEAASAAAAHAFLTSNEVRSCRSRLDDLIEGMDQTDPQFAYHWMHYNAALVRLYEPSLHVDTTQPIAGMDPSYRSNCLSACLAAASAFFTTYLPLPPDELLTLPFPVWTQLVSVVTAASRILLVPGDGTGGWDAAAARAGHDLSCVLGSAMAGLAAASSLRAQEGDSESAGGNGQVERCRYLRLSDRIKRIKDWYEMRAAMEDAESMAMPVSSGQDFGASQMAYDEVLLDSSQSQIWPASMGDDSWGAVC